MKTCENCSYWRRIETESLSTGRCHRWPPDEHQLKWRQGKPVEELTYPVTNFDGWCGEYKKG